MQAAADIIDRLQYAATRQRAPLWAAVLLPWCVLLAPGGALAAGLWTWWDVRRMNRRVEREWPRWLDASIPAMEDSSALLAGADTPLARLQQARLMRRLDGALSDEVVASIVRERMPFDWRVLGASVAAALALVAWQQLGGQPVSAREVLAQLARETSEVTLRITPPRYTGVAASTSAPRELTVPESSVVEWCLRVPQPVEAAIELSNGQNLPIGRQCARLVATETLSWRWRGQRHLLRVRPDQPPQVAIGAPGAPVHELASDAQQAAIAVSVRDDFQVRRAALHLTLARGNGAQLQLIERDLPLPESPDARTRNWSRQWSLAELGMQPGDELYLQVRATDNAEPAHTVLSPIHMLRLPEAEQASAVQPALQRRLIADTEQLLADANARRLDAAALAERSQALVDVQAHLRQDLEHQLDGDDAPAAPNVARRAVAAMAQAQDALAAQSLKAALAPQQRALAALIQLQQAARVARYRSAAANEGTARVALGSADGGLERRAQGEWAGAMPPGLRALMAALDHPGPLPAAWKADAHAWIGARLPGEAQRLAAQRAVQDVDDGCGSCRAVLRAWLRAGVATGVPTGALALHGSPAIDTRFARAWRQGGAQ